MIDLLAIAPHPDDAELLCGGTLIRAADLGHKTGILDLTSGELGTRGDRETRRAEAERATELLGLAVRRNLGLADAAIQNDQESRVRVVEAIRELRPRVVILTHLEGRHPDHRVAAQLGYDACYLAGLTNYPAGGDAYRPHKVLYCLSYREHAVKPTFVVDTSEAFERKLEAVRAYASQFDDVKAMGELFPAEIPLYDLVRVQDAHYGSLIRAAYGEPFHTRETVGVDDVVGLRVGTF
ncbi:MAG: bacillithiol biosynthesis deacetylase BshB1 [Gemmatimonadetes bacterium]|uniref:Bacillithiol biosynthesis deacetylase BshB1 n=1 Tax=Candidatus Kutchimonas denitrificans TaxID=3056748 RepID=A0AAE4Z824_9BACT|nr:bacillithiol biosynthesis deacetylase BshB1 [Gemmatimonadota bacterium]NIR74974.1 bacillithiol biosynthesis deacetylase BshB1 [Candidatus Kutchimonas denitrificans]NIS01557.1 bacillithiol biosynthesis deacetylase BshB1 [Gemmatimonadota bacterium]NIT67295.1 bacillithiol biosynthesis deacetylase BshB1 [Gemmatimonadota bacterium]NIU52658.1 bacillithiol biosynthesis deacetylase BshB1 [Gemmatimonadota bacterium]